MRPIILATSVVCLAGLTGCIDTQVRRQENTGPLLAPTETSIGINQERPDTYIKRHSAESSRMDRKVSIKTSGMALARVLSTVVPRMNVRVSDPGVDITRDTTLFVEGMRLGDFFKQLTDITGYAFQAKGRLLTISSRETRTWNIAALASNRQSRISVGGSTGFAGSNDSTNGSSALGSGLGGGGLGGSGGGLSSIGGSGGSSNGGANGSTQITSLQSEDNWEQIISQVRGYLGLEEDTNANQQVKLANVRTLGTVTVTASPEKINLVDSFLSRVSKQSQRQVHLDVKAFEVKLTDNRARGINWDAILNTTIDGGPFQVAFSSTNPIDLSGPSSTNAIAADYQNGNDEASALIRLLGRYGDVSLVTEPNLSALNGGTAYLSSVDEFSFVASVTQFLSSQGSTTVTPQLSRIRVGVTMSVTPRILPDDRILIEVTPVISSLQGFDQFNVGNFQFSNPRIALSELTTQVITRPGEPVQIGGLITSRISKEMNRLPLRRKTGLLNWLFSSEANELERREMVISITPTLTEV